MVDAVSVGVVGDDDKAAVEAILIQIMNDAEKNRQNCASQAENLRKQAATLDGQASAFASTNSIVYNVLSGFIHAAEVERSEALRIAEENKEKEAYIASHPETAGSEPAPEAKSGSKGKKKK
jgi:hypothetical protein